MPIHFGLVCFAFSFNQIQFLTYQSALYVQNKYARNFFDLIIGNLFIYEN